jgi:hypothetical protein
VNPSWIIAKCQNPIKRENLKRSGAPLRVWMRISEVEMSCEVWDQENGDV